MTQFPPSFPPARDPSRQLLPAPQSGGRWASIIVAWAIIIAGCVFVAGRHHVEKVAGQAESRASRIDLVLMELQAKYMVAAWEWAGREPDAAAQRAALYQAAAGPLNKGSVDQRLRFVALAAWLADRREAAGRLRELESDLLAPGRGEPVELTPEQAAVVVVLSKLYRAETDAPLAADAGTTVLTTEERELLIRELGWLGELAVALETPEGSPERAAISASAWRVLIGIFAALAFLGAVGVGGFAALIVMTVLVISGRVRSGLAPGWAPHHLYVETFALWMILFFGLQGLASRISQESLVPVLAGFLLSLLALGWPVLRGAAWADVRADIGWTSGKGSLREVGLGFAAYAMTLPLLAGGVVLTLLLLLIQQLASAEPMTFAPSGAPAHPVVEILCGSSWPQRIQLLVLAAVAAPIAEETMFRGVLYRHLRDATGRVGTIASIAIGTLINTFLFAIIHPQGWVAAPALMSLATGMTLAREWRGTLIPSMIVHATSNGLVMGLLMFLLNA